MNGGQVLIISILVPYMRSGREFQHCFAALKYQDLTPFADMEKTAQALLRVMKEATA